MLSFINFVKRLSRITNFLGGVILGLMMLLTVIDVILRYLGRPITGTFELMSFAGALVAGFAIAQTSLDGAHVNVDILTQRLSRWKKAIITVFTKLIGIGIFTLISWSLLLKGNDLYKTGEVSLTLHVPYYPVAYGLSFCGFVEALVLLTDVFKTVFYEVEHE
ncbi:MAG: TRAP transporter small permease [Syntrophorhabdaceae bacterium]|nr:TRAP transporter small permease [Syntrophorhabdaceae bacterium]